MIYRKTSQPAARQHVCDAFEMDDLDFAQSIVDLFGAGRLVAVAKYSGDGQSHVEVAGPLPRDWRNMIPARARRQGTPRLGWRSSRGKQLLHPVDFSQLGELAGELAEQRGARRSQ